MSRLRVCVVSGFISETSSARVIAADAYVYDWTGHHARFTETMSSTPVAGQDERHAAMRARVERKAQAWIEARS